MMNFLGKLIGGLARSQGYGLTDEEQNLDERKKRGKLQQGLMDFAAQTPKEEDEELDLTSTIRSQVGMPSGINPLQMYGNMYRSYGGRKTRGLLFD